MIQLQAQDKNSNEQSFRVKNFYIEKPLTDELAISLDFNFDILFSKEVKNPYKHPYFIHCRLFDENNTKIWENPANDKIYAVRFDGEDVISYVTHQIPYEILPLPEGAHTLHLKVSVSNQKQDFQIFFKEDIVVDIPKFYEYDEQAFIFSNSRVEQDRTTYKTPGITINFTSKASFIQNRIKGLKDDPFIGEYLFNIEIIDKNSGEKVDFFNPETARATVVVNKIKEDYKLFIPLNELKLPQGKHQLGIQIRAATKGNDKDLGKSILQNVSIVQPKLYKINVTLDSCSIKEKRYDIGSVAGRVFSSAKSNTGKGNPDVYWVLKTGDYRKYVSDVVENDFWATTGSINITVIADDSLELIFWDLDTLSRDDWIASFQLVNGVVGKTIQLNKSNTETLENLSLKYRKEAIIFD
jgi:hypothetical protein